MYGVTDFAENLYAAGNFKVDNWSISKNVSKETTIDDAYAYCNPSTKGEIGVEFFNWEDSYNGLFVVGASERKNPEKEISFSLSANEKVEIIEINCERFSC